MAQLRIGLAQVDAVVGDLPGNADAVSTWTAHAVAKGCHLVAFPEMMLTGYPPEDLVLRASFVTASLAALEQLAMRLAEAKARAGGERRPRHRVDHRARHRPSSPRGARACGHTSWATPGLPAGSRWRRRAPACGRRRPRRSRG